MNELNELANLTKRREDKVKKREIALNQEAWNCTSVL